jgi:beta-1,4-mannooligosaccharide/beta-1,4-mannosyl-N-acetylglucosamine phosphorylase
MGLSGEDVRNGVIFPEKFDNFYYRFERPNKTALDCGVTSGSSIVLSKSKDLQNWEFVSKVMDGNKYYWDERIGSGPTPIKTREGWIHIYHGISDHFTPIYQAGVSLHDLKNPQNVISRCRFNILEPREMWEMVGQVPNVCFPSGAVVFDYDEDGFARPDSKVYIYYGAADTVIGLAETTVQDLIDLSKRT